MPQISPKSYSELRGRYPVFRYRSHQYEIDGGRLHCRFHFAIDGLCDFTPSWSFPLPDRHTNLGRKINGELTGGGNSSDPILDAAIFRLGMAEMISYWKACCCPDIIVENATLSSTDQTFWTKLFWLGLGEFRYLNGIMEDRRSFVHLCSTYASPLACEAESVSAQVPTVPDHDLRLIPVGGGKDSVVTLNCLEPLRSSNYLYAINPVPAVKRCIQVAHYPAERVLYAERRLDPRLLELNREGYLNGHTPFSAIVAFSAAITAYLHGIRDIILSNEASADESSVKGLEINHQYSKSSEFELDFAAYCDELSHGRLRYFSLLRPFSELAIARRFSRLEAYFPAFVSCNRGSREGVWCGHCAKCLFIAVMLLPFIGIRRCAEILGGDVFAREDMLDELLRLCGAGACKPFECVGTVHEVSLALAMFLNRQQAERPHKTMEPLPPLLLQLRSIAIADGLPDLAYDKTNLRFYTRENARPLEARAEAPNIPPVYLPYIAGFLDDANEPDAAESPGGSEYHKGEANHA